MNSNARAEQQYPTASAADPLTGKNDS